LSGLFCLRMPLDDPLGLDDPLVTAAPMVRRNVTPVLPGPLGEEHADQVAHRLYQSAIGLTLETVTDSPSGMSITRQERPPDVKAALAVLTTLRPGTWRDDRPVTAVQFVIHAPAVAVSTQAWLAQYGPGGTARDTPRPAITVQSEPGQVVPTASGPVPDPLAVPHSLSVRPKPSRKNIKSRIP
jgi:hypothetical protein